MNWVSGVIGFAGAGYVLDTFGGTSLYGAAAIAACLAVIILVFLPSSRRLQRSYVAADTQGPVPTTGD
jgi:mannose/fructose/N-acetylgalactosamine-specific phosphotransferase system component IIC